MIASEIGLSIVILSISVIFVCGAVLACAAVYKVLKDGWGG